MLSELPQLQTKLLGLVWNGINLKGLIEPGSKIPMSKEVHPQQGHQVGKKPVELRPKLKKAQDQNRNQCCPNLNPDGIGTSPYKRLDLKILFQGFKENLDLPTVFVDSHNCCCSQPQVVGQKREHFPVLLVISFDASKRMGTFLDGLDPSEFDQLIFEDIAILGEFLLSHHFVQGVVLHSGNEKDPLSGPLAKKIFFKTLSIVLQSKALTKKAIQSFVNRAFAGLPEVLQPRILTLE